MDTSNPFINFSQYGSAAAISQSLWLIIALPLLGALICGVFGRMLGRANTGLIACAAVGGSFLLCWLAFWAVNDFKTAQANPFGSPVVYALGHDYGTWFAAGDFRVQFGLQVDHLTGILLLVITGVGLLIHIYSTSYMGRDEGFARYFAYLNLFVAMMLTLVLADNLVLLFVGWEGVGMASYLLIGFWYADSAKAFAGRKAFITNRIGDFAFLIGAFLIVILVSAFNRQAGSDNFQGIMGGAEANQAQFQRGLAQAGPLTFRGMEEVARALPATDADRAKVSLGPGAITLETPISEGPLKGFSFGGVLTASLLLFFLGAAGKSAQLPLYVWLPDAMAGPTPVSALIHAATMVTAGVYLFCRMHFFLVLSPQTMAVIAVVGALTALFAALIAFAQDDIKKVLAYSTVSQLGFMFMAVGMGVFWAAVLHLVTHAFFKACLFLGAGSVMHGNDDETDIKKLGGLRKEMKLTWLTFGIATLAATGIVPLSGFFSKDAILHGVHSTVLKGQPWAPGFVYWVGTLTAVCTAFYMVRLYLLTFEGKRSPHAKIAHAHESDAAMTTPLLVLAALSVVAIVYGIPIMTPHGGGEKQAVMENFLLPVFFNSNTSRDVMGLVTTHHGGSLVGAWIQAWILACVGGAIAFFLYTRFFPGKAGQPAPAALAAVRKFAVNKFYVDELYDYALIRPLKGLAFILWKVVDTLAIDTVAVRGTAWLTARVGSALRLFQTGDTQSYAAVMAVALMGAAAYAIFKVVS